MRKIFNTLETTPRCEAERLASGIARDLYQAALTRDQDLKTRSASVNLNLAKEQKIEADLSTQQNANSKERERLEEGKKDADKELKSYGSTCYIIPWYCGSLIRNYNYYVDAIQICKDIADKIFSYGCIINPNIRDYKTIN